jgi:hypothetical protein
MPAGEKKKTNTKQARVARITAFTGGQAKAEKTGTKPVTEAEAKAEVKTEAKVEAKPGEAKTKEAGPGGTEPKRSSGQGGTGVGFGTIEVPGSIIEGVARELGTAVTIVKPLVEWVVNYLNRPCCWSVGLDRLVMDLAKVRGEEVRYSLFVLGFEGGASKVTDEGFALLRRVLLVIIKYLRLAGFVEYIEDLGVVNYVRR